MIKVEVNERADGPMKTKTTTYSTDLEFHGEAVWVKSIESTLSGRTLTSWAVRLGGSETWISPFRSAAKAIGFYGGKQ